MITTDEFFAAYDRLAATGACDSAGGMEYKRVRSEWINAGKPSGAELDAFIRRRANWVTVERVMTLPELAKLLEAATPGPYEATEGCAVFVDGTNLIADTFMSGADHPGAQGIPMPWSQPQCVANAAAIAAMMNAAPRLLALARAAVALLAKHDRLERRAQGRGADPMYMFESEEIDALRAAIDALGAEA